MSVVWKVTGTKFSIDALNSLDGRLRFKHVRIALFAGGGVIKRAAIRNAPKDSGLLQKSIRVKVKVPDASYNKSHHGKPAYAVIGPGRGIVGFRSKTGRISAKTLAAATKTASISKGKIVTVKERDRFIPLGGGKLLTFNRRASRYAHFAEKGRKGKGGTHFLANAATQSAPAAIAAIQSKLADGIVEVCGQIFAQQFAEQVTLA